MHLCSQYLIHLYTPWLLSTSPSLQVPCEHAPSPQRQLGNWQGEGARHPLHQVQDPLPRGVHPATQSVRGLPEGEDRNSTGYCVVDAIYSPPCICDINGGHLEKQIPITVVYLPPKMATIYIAVVKINMDQFYWLFSPFSFWRVTMVSCVRCWSRSFLRSAKYVNQISSIYCGCGYIVGVA